MASASARGKDDAVAVRLAPKVTMPEQASADLLKETTNRFEISHLDFFYGPKQALFNLGLKIPTNRITALIGPSGCGKSTFLRNLNRKSTRLNSSHMSISY